MTRLNFNVTVRGERISAKDWRRIALRIAKAANGRATTREISIVCLEQSLTRSESGRIKFYKH